MNVTNWDQAYQENFTPWDKGQPAPPLVEWVARHALTGRVLVPGCGVGHDVAHLVSRDIDAYGLDIAPTAVARAKEHYPQLAERFECADLFNFKCQYDAIVEHTCLCALPPEWRGKYRDAVASLLKPGGLLVGVFFINPEMDPGETGPPFGISEDDLTTLFAEDFEVIENYLPGAAYPGREGRERLRVLRLTGGPESARR
ncbi:methyltransferase [Prosthecobacter sp.]|uniref:methyltransferase n=1 Tax=Prosthecobacter sp. TaxID=1965333 RepID=UPI0037850F93